MVQGKLPRENFPSRPHSTMHEDCINLSLDVIRKTQIISA